MSYKISGSSNDYCKIRVFEGDTYLGHADVNAGNYEVNFDATTTTGIDVIASNPSGRLVGYGNTGVLASVAPSDLTPPVSMGIESIQTGTIVVLNGETGNTGTITAVDLSKTMLLYNGGAHTAGAGWSYSGQQAAFRFQLTDTTTVTATRQSTTGQIDLRYTVVEFTSGIKSINRGTISLVNVANNTSTIDAVDTSKTIVNYIGHSTSNGSHENKPYIWLANSTTVQAYCDNVNNTTIVAYEAIEFD